MKEKIITFNQVNMSYQTKYQRIPLLNNLNLSFEKGEFAVILGPSGTGKTTLLNLIAGFLKFESGEILVNGKDISKLNETEICNFRNKHLGFIFQFYNLIHSLNTEQNILAPLLISGLDKSRAECRVNELLEKFGMMHRRFHHPMELSGGEQQRVAIARALANHPDIILADEPTGNLDKKNGHIILDMLSEINKEGKTIIIVTHDMNLVDRATKVYRMDDLLKLNI